MIEDAEGKWAKYEVLAQVVAQVDALQQRLTAADERLDHAVTALNEIARISRMGEEPFEIATLAIGEMSALRPAEAPLNQCDGCQAGIPIVNGAHRMGKPGGYPDTMSCTAKLYTP